MSRHTRKQTICLCEYMDHIIQSLYFLNPKFQASYYLLWLYRLVCVNPDFCVVFISRKGTFSIFRKHSSGDLHSRLKTRKLLGVGETDDGDVHRSKVNCQETTRGGGNR